MSKTKNKRVIICKTLGNEELTQEEIENRICNEAEEYLNMRYYDSEVEETVQEIFDKMLELSQKTQLYPRYM